MDFHTIDTLVGVPKSTGGCAMEEPPSDRVGGSRMVVLPIEGTDESGWLTCAKLTALNGHIRQPVRVVLIAPEVRPGMAALARRAGAVAILPATADAETIDEALHTLPVPTPLSN